jgi:hypothetical protein
VFSIWSVVLLVIGFQIVGGLSRGSAIAAVTTSWLLGVGLKVAAFSIMSSMMGGG